jgi:hypothetical protein
MWNTGYGNREHAGPYSYFKGLAVFLFLVSDSQANSILIKGARLISFCLLRAHVPVYS